VVGHIVVKALYPYMSLSTMLAEDKKMRAGCSQVYWACILRGTVMAAIILGFYWEYKELRGIALFVSLSILMFSGRASQMILNCQIKRQWLRLRGSSQQLRSVTKNP